MYSSKALRARRKNFLSYNYASSPTLPKSPTGVASPTTTPQRQTTTHATPREPNRSDLKAMVFKSPQITAYYDKDTQVKKENKKTGTKKLPGTKLLKLLEKKQNCSSVKRKELPVGQLFQNNLIFFVLFPLQFLERFALKELPFLRRSIISALRSNNSLLQFFNCAFQL